MRLYPAKREPNVALLLDIDQRYRDGTADNTLPCTAPKRFNPVSKAWLPFFHYARRLALYRSVFEYCVGVLSEQY